MSGHKFYYICDKCEMKIEAYTNQPSPAKMIQGKKKVEYVFLCKEGCKNV